MSNRVYRFNLAFAFSVTIPTHISLERDHRMRCSSVEVAVVWLVCQWSMDVLGVCEDISAAFVWAYGGFFKWNLSLLGF